MSLFGAVVNAKTSDFLHEEAWDFRRWKERWKAWVLWAELKGRAALESAFKQLILTPLFQVVSLEVRKLCERRDEAA